MANITEEHLHHMAKRHHATMKKLEGIREKAAATVGRFVSTLETGAGAWLGGAIEGKTGGATLPLNIPVNLGVGAGLLAAAHFDVAGPQWSDHLNNLANGFISSYAAATGYAFGSNWRKGSFGSALRGMGHPYDLPGAVSGDLSEAQMAAIVSRMQAAAAGG
jgi:hypothetical protein